MKGSSQNKIVKQGKLFVISGPSGVGKKTLLSELVKNEELNLSINISCTSRSPRKGEINKKDYYFISKEEFQSLIVENKFLEYAYFFGEYYGTLRDTVQELLENGRNVILEIEVLGFHQIKEKVKDFISIFIYPPSIEHLKERLLLRKTENSESIVKRLQKAEEELKEIINFQYKVLNDSIDQALLSLTQIVTQEINKG
ncbi:guanylate kinase [Mycoplasma parvum]|uniref:guanylate kinase n=1 Tax=Mycoplasma parvum TaxID=984991 RepID=UPI000693C2FF|nr:guanylate kinase [Mycoplasma parvum]